MTNFTLILILCFFGQIFCARHESAFKSAKSQGRNSLEIRLIDRNSEKPDLDDTNEIPEALPLFAQNRSQPKLGETWELTCGYILSTENRIAIREIHWFTWEPNNVREFAKITKNTTQRFSVHTNNNTHAYKLVLTVRNLTESDDGRGFYCQAFFDIDGRQVWQNVHRFTLEFMDTSFPDPPLQVHATTDPHSRTLRDVVKVIDNKLDETVEDTLPLFAQDKTQLMLGEPAQFICGFKLSKKRNLHDIGEVKWSTAECNGTGSPTEILKDPNQNIFVKPYKKGDEFRQILSIKNLTELDRRRLYCDANIRINRTKRWQRIHALTLDSSGSDTSYPRIRTNSLKFRIIDNKPNRSVKGALPFTKSELQPRLGETIELTCGYNRIMMKPHVIETVVWQTYDPRIDQVVLQVQEEVQQGLYQKFSVRTHNDSSEHKKVLIVRDLTESDDERRFDCFAFIVINGHEKWERAQQLELKLDESIIDPSNTIH